MPEYSRHKVCGLYTSIAENGCPKCEEVRKARLAKASPALLAALKDLVGIILDGSHYETQNPYTRPQVKAALAAIAEAEGGKP